MKTFMFLTDIAREIGPYELKTLQNMNANGKLKKAGVEITYPVGKGKPVVKVDSYLRFIQGVKDKPADFDRPLTPLELERATAQSK
ncbi:MAG: hypothetical protein HZA22_04525 [Nitrospirae bacterium]|nr:hypothetical protein [Nitrospirota bacterium]